MNAVVGQPALQEEDEFQSRALKSEIVRLALAGTAGSPVVFAIEFTKALSTLHIKFICRAS